KASFGAYGGAETATSFGDTGRELRALWDGCGIYDLGRRSKILVKGADRDRWMNGMVTNNVRDLPQDHGVFCYLLNAQGQIQADMYIYQRGEHLVVDTDQSQRERLLELFDKFIIMDDVTLEDDSERIAAIGVHGPKAPEVLRRLGHNVTPMAPLQMI